MRQATGLSQDIVDRAAALSARPTATKDLIDAMARLSDSYHEVEAMLNEIQELIKVSKNLTLFTSLCILARNAHYHSS